MPYINSFERTERQINERLDCTHQREQCLLQKRRKNGMQILLYNKKTKNLEIQIAWEVKARKYRAPMSSTWEMGVFFSLCDEFNSTIYVPTDDICVANQLVRDYVKTPYLDLTKSNVKNIGTCTHYGMAPKSV